MRVLVLDGVDQQAVEILKEAGIQADIHNDKMTEQDLVAKLPSYDGVIVRSGTKITRNALESAGRLKVIGRAGVGVDNIDVNAASEKGILVVNAPDGNTVATAEHTMALILAMTRNVPQAHKSLKDGQWLRKQFTGVELQGKVLGIIGLGKIGSAVACRAKAFDMRVIAHDPYADEKTAQELGVELLSLADVLGQADFLTVHTPKSDNTHHLINAEAFEMMKDGVRIANVARGGIIDEIALYDALVSGKAAAAALDVYEQEPPTNTKLIELNNVIVTPHLGASTKEAQIKVALEVARDITAVLQGKKPQNAVNDSINGALVAG